jgi:rare lipoprotein A (peptidoglycan hydrolase)
VRTRAISAFPSHRIAAPRLLAWLAIGLLPMMSASCSSVNGMYSSISSTLSSEPAPTPPAPEIPPPSEEPAAREEKKPEAGEIRVVRPGDPEHPGLPIDGKVPTLIKNLELGALFPPEKGSASYYITDKERSRRRYPVESKMTAAHKTLPFGSVVRCTRPDTGESVVVTINDRGPFIQGRVIDLSRTAAAKLNMFTEGVVDCTVEVLMYPMAELKKAVQNNTLGDISSRIPQALMEELKGN